MGRWEIQSYILTTAKDLEKGKHKIRWFCSDLIVHGRRGEYVVYLCRCFSPPPHIARNLMVAKKYELILADWEVVDSDLYSDMKLAG